MAVTAINMLALDGRQGRKGSGGEGFVEEGVRVGGAALGRRHTHGWHRLGPRREMYMQKASRYAGVTWTKRRFSLGVTPS